jgi:hypothetical protein
MEMAVNHRTIFMLGDRVTHNFDFRRDAVGHVVRPFVHGLIGYELAAVAGAGKAALA